MSTLVSKLNLRPQERRLLVFVGVVVFVVLNIWLVWPRFNDWRQVKGGHEKAVAELQRYKKEVAQIPRFESKLRELETIGSNVIPEEQDLDLVRIVQTQTRLSGVFVTRQDARPRASNTKTNQFFEEQTMTMGIEARNEELVKFLVSMASTNSLIRVQELGLRQDNPANPTKLIGNVTLVASYQKSPPVTPASSSAATNATVIAKPPIAAVKAAATSSNLAKPIVSKVQTPGSP